MTATKNNTPGTSADLKRKIRAAALASALVPLASVMAANDAEAGMPPTLFGPRSSFVSGSVDPAVGGGFDYSFILHNTTPTCLDTGPGACDPEIFGGEEPLIVDWELPLFSLNGIDLDSITAPDGWDYEIITPTGEVVAPVGAWEGGSPGDHSFYYGTTEGPYGFYEWEFDASASPGDPGFDPVLGADEDVYGDTPEVFEDPPILLHFFACADPGAALTGGPGAAEVGAPGAGCGAPVPPFFFAFPGDEVVEVGESLVGFGFHADVEGTNAPYQASWFFEPATLGDPPIPDGGSGPTSGFTPNNAIPEPGTLAVFGTGLLALFGLRRRRK